MAVYDLSQNLDFSPAGSYPDTANNDPDNSITNPLSFDQTFPCASALIGIGEPLVSAVAQKFGESKTENERRLLLYVLARIKGGEWTSSFLEERIADAQSKDDQEKLRSFQVWVRSFER